MIMNKFLRTLYIVPLSFLLTGCWTSIYTVSEPVVVHEKKPAPTYVTTVTTSSPKVKTVTTFTVTRYNTDPCFYLDLNAVAAAFAESNSVRDFEQILNSSRYMINNLDLNRDGWVDYVRVIETSKGYYHSLLLQACLAPGVFQDVATIVAERRPDVLFVEVIGDRYLYGYNYIVRPVFVKRPPLWTAYGRSTYAVWSSPYYYGAFPSYYTQPKPVYINHYQAYVKTYMTNHRYCHHCDYPSQPFYSGYTEMTRSYSRNDYGAQYPSDSFDQRVTRAAASSGVTVRNAEQLRMEVEKTSPRTSGAITGTSGSSVSNAPGTSKSSGTTGASGSSTTTRSSGATSATRTSNTSNVTRSSGTSGSSNTSRSSGAVNSISTRVNKSGTTRTTVTTTDETGRTNTVKRESVNTTRTGSIGAQRNGTSTRTSGAISAPDTQTSSSPRSGQRVR